jgi:hypothetical protein
MNMDRVGRRVVRRVFVAVTRISHWARPGTSSLGRIGCLRSDDMGYLSHAGLRDLPNFGTTFSDLATLKCIMRLSKALEFGWGGQRFGSHQGE